MDIFGLVVTVIVLLIAAVAILWWIVTNAKMKQRAALLKQIVRQNDFKYEDGRYWFARNTDKLTAEDPDFDLFLQPYGAAYRKINGRLIGIRAQTEADDDDTWFNAIEIQLEPKWPNVATDGPTDAKFISLCHRSEAARTYDKPWLGIRLTCDGTLRPEMCELKPFASKDEQFNALFPHRRGGYRVRRALQTTDQLASLTARLSRWRDLFYDLNMDQKEYLVRIDCRRVKSWTTFAGELMELLTSLESFVDQLEQVVTSFEFSAGDFDKPHPRYVGVTALTTCQHCGTGLPLNGLITDPVCSACNQPNSFDADRWQRVLYQPYVEYESAEGPLVCLIEEVKLGEWKAELPTCPGCQAPLPEDLLAGQTGEEPITFPCPACDHPNNSSPAPTWVSRLAPQVARVFNAETSTAAPGAAPGGLPVDEEAVKPVLFACPQCGANLKITADAERTSTCEFCQASIYLPDGLWRKLHPVKTTARWHIRYDHLVPKS